MAPRVASKPVSVKTSPIFSGSLWSLAFASGASSMPGMSIRVT